MDHDLDAMTREQLISEVKKLRTGVRAYRASLDAQCPGAARSHQEYGGKP